MELPKPYYENENGKLYHGDCMDILPGLDPVDLVLTDPPYDKDATHKKHLKTIPLSRGNLSLDFNGFDEKSFLVIIKSIIEKSRRWSVFTCEWQYMKSLQDMGVLIRFGIWRKRNGCPQFTGDRPGMGWEAIAICHGPGKKKWNGGGKHAFYDHNVKCDYHPTQKPISLFTELIRDFSNLGDIVLDPFVGSGTTASVCERLNRKWIGIEISEKYCEIAAKRIEKEREQLQLFPEFPETRIEKPKQIAFFKD